MQFKLKNNQILSIISEKLNAETAELDKNQTENIKIALGEVLQNIIRHGHKNILNDDDLIDIECQRVDDKLVILIRDYAKPCEPKNFMQKDYKPNEDGHMGLSIIRKLTHEFKIQPLENGNQTFLSFNLRNKT